VAGLFTVEFFRGATEKLTPGGVFCFWFHEYDQSEQTVELVLRTLGAVFPEVTVFRVHGTTDVIALASTSPLATDFARMEERFDDPRIRNEMARVGILNMVTLVAHHAISPQRFRALLGPGAVNTDLRQRLEYQAPRAFFRGDVSYFVAKHDVLQQNGMGQTDSLLDRYVEFRAADGQPVSRAELATAATQLRMRSMPNPRFLRALVFREERALTDEAASTRPSRGGRPEDLGFHEAYARAAVLHSSGRVQEAIELYLKALALRPTNGLATCNLSLALTECEAVDDAIRLLEAAIPAHPKDERMKSALGRALERKGDRERAKEVYRDVASRSDFPESLTNLAKLLDGEGLRAEAISLYERALRTNEAYWYAAHGLATILGRDAATRERALSLLENALEHSPGNVALMELHQQIAATR
jgi:tetratricopeptide (TPR) repeat protein